MTSALFITMCAFPYIFMLKMRRSRAAHQVVGCEHLMHASYGPRKKNVTTACPLQNVVENTFKKLEWNGSNKWKFRVGQHGAGCK